MTYAEAVRIAHETVKYWDANALQAAAVTHARNVIAIAERCDGLLTELASLRAVYLEGSTDATRRIREMRIEHEADLGRMRAVYEAALAWRMGRDKTRVGTAPSGGTRSATGQALIDAVDAALADRTPDEDRTP